MAERYPWGKCLLEADFSRSSASVHAPLAGAGADRRLDLGCPLGAVGDDLRRISPSTLRQWLLNVEVAPHLMRRAAGSQVGPERG
jgi:hypothetical protein